MTQASNKYTLLQTASTTISRPKNQPVNGSVLVYEMALVLWIFLAFVVRDCIGMAVGLKEWFRDLYTLFSVSFLWKIGGIMKCTLGN
jgi:hypothetical protein